MIAALVLAIASPPPPAQADRCRSFSLEYDAGDRLPGDDLAGLASAARERWSMVTREPGNGDLRLRIKRTLDVQPAPVSPFQQVRLCASVRWASAGHPGVWSAPLDLDCRSPPRWSPDQDAARREGLALWPALWESSLGRLGPMTERACTAPRRSARTAASDSRSAARSVEPLTVPPEGSPSVRTPGPSTQAPGFHYTTPTSIGAGLLIFLLLLAVGRSRRLQIFVCHSHRDAALADKLANRLRADGHRVFHDETSLPKGGAFDGEIRRRIQACDVFLFLLSPDSVSPGSYALTELKVVQNRWPNPAGLRVLPIVARDVPIDQVPGYLAAVNILRPVGETIADVGLEIAARWRQLFRRRALVALAPAALAAGLVAWAPSWPARSEPALTRPDPAPDGNDSGAATDAAGDVGRSHTLVSQKPPQLELRRPPKPAMPAGRREPPAMPAISFPARFFPTSQQCLPQLERDAGSWWLVCRCPAETSVSTPLIFADADSPETESLWQRAAQAAARTSWRCP